MFSQSVVVLRRSRTRRTGPKALRLFFAPQRLVTSESATTRPESRQHVTKNCNRSVIACRNHKALSAYFTEITIDQRSTVCLRSQKVECSMRDKSDLEHLRTELEEKQSATTFPETIRAGRSVDEFLWKGDPKATRVQRVGLFIFAAMFLFLFVCFLAIMIVMFVKRDFDWVSFLIVLMFATLSGIAGFRFLFNAFRHQKHHKVNH
jgi:hypothetical protein